MRSIRTLVLIFAALTLCAFADDVSRVQGAIKRSTLDQLGTKPFHLKAVLAVSRERDQESGRTGQVEIWWASPARYRREVRSPMFHQIEIVDGDHRWQKTEGDYFPEWLRLAAVELVRPVPNVEEALAGVRDADVKTMMGSTHFQWTITSTDGHVQSGMGGSVAVTNSTGLLSYCGGTGWGALFEGYKNFHGRMVATKVKVGSPEVTATVETLEDLNATPDGWFDGQAPGADRHLLDTIVVDELSARKHLLEQPAVQWPALQDRPFEGVVTTQIVIDRSGRIRDMGPIVATNPAVKDVARDAISSMKFSPYEVNGGPVQVITRITLPFKTEQPGAEAFDSAHDYFERSRKAGFLAANAGPPYAIKAEFEVGIEGRVEKGEYEDTWMSETQWRREARILNSRCIRSRNGEKTYALAEGPQAGLLKFVLRLMEPIPAIDTFTESDWHIKRDSTDDIPAIRLLSGYVNPVGEFDPNVRAYWFADNGDLLRLRVQGFDVVRSDFQDHSGVHVARKIAVRKGGSLAMRISVSDIATPAAVSSKEFELRGHEWNRSLTDEVR